MAATATTCVRPLLEPLDRETFQCLQLLELKYNQLGLKCAVILALPSVFPQYNDFHACKSEKSYLYVVQVEACGVLILIELGLL